MTDDKIIGIKELRWQYFMLDRCIWVSMIDLYKNSNNLHGQLDREHFRGGLHELKQSLIDFADCSHWRIGYDKDFDILKSSISLANTLDSILSDVAADDISLSLFHDLEIIKAGEYIWNYIILDRYGLGAKALLATILELAKLNPEALNRIIFFSSEGEFFPEEGTNKLDLINKIKQKFSKKAKALNEEIILPEKLLSLQEVKIFLSKNGERDTETIELFSKIFEKFSVVEK